MAYELKTKPTDTTVAAFLEAVRDEGRREDGKAVARLIGEVTGEPAAMWGPSIVGFGRYSYTYASGHSGEMCQIGFSPRKAQLVFYGMAGFEGREAFLERLGKHKTGKGCLYINKLSDVDLGVLRQIVEQAWAARGAPRQPSQD